MNIHNFARLYEAFQTALLADVTARPDAYALHTYKPEWTPAAYAARMSDQLVGEILSAPTAVNYNTKDFACACAAIGIEHSRKAILAYLEIT